MAKKESFEELMRLADRKKREDEAVEKIKQSQIKAKQERDKELARERLAQSAAREKEREKQSAKQKIGIHVSNNEKESDKVAKKRAPEIIVSKASSSSKQASSNLNQPVFVDRDHTSSALSSQRKSAIRLNPLPKAPEYPTHRTVAKLGIPRQNVFKRSKSAEPPARANSSSFSRMGSPNSRVRLSGGIKAGMVPLNQKKRDLRSIEEIQAESRIRRAKLNGTFVEPSTEAKTTSSRPGEMARPGDSMRPGEKQKAARPVGAKNTKKMEQAAAQLQMQQEEIRKQQERREWGRRDNGAGTSSSSSYQHEQAPPAKRRRSSSAASAPKRHRDEDLDDEYLKGNMSSVIGEMFGYNRNRYQDEYSDDSSDMEAGFDDVRKEEARSNRLGREEDRKEEARLERLAKSKGKR